MLLHDVYNVADSASHVIYNSRQTVHLFHQAVWSNVGTAVCYKKQLAIHEWRWQQVKLLSLHHTAEYHRLTFSLASPGAQDWHQLWNTMLCISNDYVFILLIMYSVIFIAHQSWY